METSFEASGNTSLKIFRCILNAFIIGTLTICSQHRINMKGIWANTRMNDHISNHGVFIISKLFSAA